MKQINVVIDEDGNVSFEANGFQGCSCEQAIEKISQDIGKVKDTKLKSEYYLINQENIFRQEEIDNG